MWDNMSFSITFEIDRPLIMTRQECRQMKLPHARDKALLPLHSVEMQRDKNKMDEVPQTKKEKGIELDGSTASLLEDNQSKALVKKRTVAIFKLGIRGKIHEHIALNFKKSYN